jgi:hypothetical protein
MGPVRHLRRPRTSPKEIKDAGGQAVCAPAAAFLAHESCPLNGEVLLIGMGNVSRIAAVRSQGVFKSPLTAADIAENLDQIMDLNDAQVTESTRSVL